MLREGNHPVPPELLKFGTHVKKKECVPGSLLLSCSRSLLSPRSKLYGSHFKDVDSSAKGTKITFD